MTSVQPSAIGVLISGGDAPGMNAALRAVARRSSGGWICDRLRMRSLSRPSSGLRRLMNWAKEVGAFQVRR